MRFAAERDGTRATVTGLYVELCLIYETRHRGNATRLVEAADNGRQDSVAGEHHVHETPALAATELDASFRQSEERVVAASSDVLTRMEPSAALTHDDGTRRYGRAVEDLYAEPLRGESRPLRVEPPPLVLDMSSPSLAKLGAPTRQGAVMDVISIVA